VTDKKRLGYFTILGIGEDAGTEELEERYRELAEYFSSPDLPPHLREWGAEMAALVEEAYAVLAAGDAAEPQEHEPRRSVVASRAAREPAQARDEAPRGPGQRRRWDVRSGGMRIALQSLIVGVPLGLVLLGAILFASSTLSDGKDEEVRLPDHDAFLAPDEERINLLLQVVEDDPQNVDALFELGERFFLANEWELSLQWFLRLVDVDPDNVYGWTPHAWTDIGTSQFNLGRPEQAREAWLKALDMDPNDVQVHYNLGFYYANVEPVDLDAATERWLVVMELAPDSDLARIVRVHLEALEEELAEVEADTAAP
jgi:tetratricopeptide (TPR) repeat protein